MFALGWNIFTCNWSKTMKSQKLNDGDIFLSHSTELSLNSSIELSPSLLSLIHFERFTPSNTTVRQESRLEDFAHDSQSRSHMTSQKSSASTLYANVVSDDDSVTPLPPPLLLLDNVPNSPSRITKHVHYHKFTIITKRRILKFIWAVICSLFWFDSEWQLCFKHTDTRRQIFSFFFPYESTLLPIKSTLQVKQSEMSFFTKLSLAS